MGKESLLLPATANPSAANTIYGLEVTARIRAIVRPLTVQRCYTEAWDQAGARIETRDSRSSLTVQHWLVVGK